jgi:hypothetical protein
MFAMPLTLRNTYPAHERVPAYKDVPDYAVMSGGLRVGRIYENRSWTQAGDRWSWAINGVHAGPDVMALTGRAATLERAKTDFKDNWEKWLARAKLAETQGVMMPFTS